MARISTASVLPSGTQIGLDLDRYAEIMGLDMCDFNGVNKPTTQRDEICHAIIKQTERDRLQRYLVQAEQMRERWLNYYLTPKYKTEEQRVGANNPFILEKKYLVEVGYPTLVDIELGAIVDHGPADPTPSDPPNDPVEVTVTTSVATDQIRVYYPDEDIGINPTDIVDNGDGTVTISIPRCRLVKPEYNDDRDDPLGYYDNTYFLTTVDVKRMYSDESNGAEFVWIRPGCHYRSCVPQCQRACPMITGEMANLLSIVRLFPATYTSGSWTIGSFTYCDKPDSARIHYLSGRDDPSDEIMTIRLAHTLMPRSPCNCDIANGSWEDDREIVERTFTTYGSRRGAIETWMHDKDARVAAGGMFPGMHT